MNLREKNSIFLQISSDERVSVVRTLYTASISDLLDFEISHIRNFCTGMVVTTFIKWLDHDVVLAVEFCSQGGRLLSGSDPEPLEAPPGVDREVTVGAGPLVAGRSSKLTGR